MAGKLTLRMTLPMLFPHATAICPPFSVQASVAARLVAMEMRARRTGAFFSLAVSVLAVSEDSLLWALRCGHGAQVRLLFLPLSYYS